MKGKQICSYLKSVRREVAAANGIDLEIPDCTFEGECPGTCPRCEAEVRQLEQALSHRQSLSQKVAIVGVAMGLAFSGMSVASAQNVNPQDSIDDEVMWVGMEAPLQPIPQVRAEFPGGTDALRAFLAENCHYPKEAREKQQQGVVLLEFVIEKDGTISTITVLRGVCEALDEEAIRVVKAMPKWKPGENDGQPCRSFFQLPITFTLE
jgi:TonB family protein